MDSSQSRKSVIRFGYTIFSEHFICIKNPPEKQAKIFLTLIAPIVHPKMKTGKEFPSAGIRFHVISARQVRFPSSPGLVRAPRAPSAFIRFRRDKLPLRHSECVAADVSRLKLLSRRNNERTHVRCYDWNGKRAPSRAPSKIAQPFMAGTRGSPFSKVPSGTKGACTRPPLWTATTFSAVPRGTFTFDGRISQP